MTVGSLFSGIGGLDLGLERAGFEVRWQVEIDPFCQKVLEKHWPGVKRYGDITKLTGEELERVDLICGGFPCQDVSVAGLRKGVGEGTRSGLYADMLRLISALRPRYALLENVTGLLIPTERDEPAPIARVLGDLAEIGYDAEWDCIPAAALGAPHIRDRVWILAYPRQECGDVAWWADPKRRRHDVLPEGIDRDASEWCQDWQLVTLVPGVHPRVAADWWRSQSRMDRSVDGIPPRTHECRVGALGNAVVPQVAEWIGRRIQEATNV